jgi:ParB family chromosome partitioning protein
LKKYGQIEPIVITTGGKLVAGQRRLEAAKKLGWTEIESHIVDVDDAADLLELEIEENLQRKPFDEADLLAGYNRLDKLRNPSFFMGIIIAIKKFFAKIFGRKK